MRGCRPASPAGPSTRSRRSRRGRRRRRPNFASTNACTASSIDAYHGGQYELDRHAAADLEPERARHGRVSLEPVHGGRLDAAAVDQPRRRQVLHAEAERLEPLVALRAVVREPSEPERLGREREVLDHQPLLDRDELLHVALHVEDRCNRARVQVVAQVAAPGLREPLDAGRPVAVAFVEEVEAGLPAEEQEQHRQHERRHVGDEQEVRRAGHVGRPAVERRHERRPPLQVGPPVGDADARLLVESGVVAAPPALGQLGDLLLGEVLRPRDLEGTVVVQQERGRGVDPVGARDRPPGPPDDDDPLARVRLGTRVVGQVAEREPGDPARGEREDRLLLGGSGTGSCALAWSNGPPCERVPEREPPRATARDRVHEADIVERAAEALVDGVSLGLHRTRAYDAACASVELGCLVGSELRQERLRCKQSNPAVLAERKQMLAVARREHVRLRGDRTRQDCVVSGVVGDDGEPVRIGKPSCRQLGEQELRAGKLRARC